MDLKELTEAKQHQERFITHVITPAHYACSPACHHLTETTALHKVHNQSSLTLVEPKA